VNTLQINSGPGGDNNSGTGAGGIGGSVSGIALNIGGSLGSLNVDAGGAGMAEMPWAQLQPGAKVAQ
jgi:hypothetical protein